MDTAKNLNELINYQEGSVVSREIVKKPSGNVTLFAFDIGQGLSEHKSPYDALVIVTDGLAEVTISGKKHKVKAGETIMMKADEPHALKAIERFKMVLIMIK
ncbi:MAG TPA: cupin domain-containing protein [Candidatus Dojkabacteria bacterium]|nr:cupin domain-containing protein [Candidatus Dojkabacteria bacterium]HRP51391.1 cupin domain-containing protein [Candidatus Dojkabacteria bacterium]